jgi:hypothetical protein
MIYPIIFVVYLSLLYFAIGYDRILNRYQMYFDKEYWTDYNIIELSAWMAKAVIIIPGLIFGIELWYMHFLTLATSSALIWASMRKSLPTLILFNTIWICISLTIIIKHLYGV